jgi:excisionase family DNA binding protein
MRDRSEWVSTKEAAELLGVSEASIRRWSDRGVLPGRRIGVRRDRRFRAEDVRRLRPKSRSGHPTLGQLVSTTQVGPVSINDHTHIATFYDSDAGRLRLAVPFLTEGLRTGAPCILLAHGAVRKAYFGALKRSTNGVIDQALAKGLLHVSQGPGSTVNEALEFWESVFWDAMGRRGMPIRVVGEATSVRDQFESETEMLTFEAAMNMTVRRFPCIVICQYDVRHFTGQALLSALRAHPDLYTLPIGHFLLS